jgi:hypothetical protein
MKRTIPSIISIAVLLGFFAGCGGGGGDQGRVTGQTIDKFGAAVGGSSITIVLSGLTDIYHPATDGNFDFSVPAGTYTAEFLWYDDGQGVEIVHQQSITVITGQTLSLGQVTLENTELTAGWASYRSGDYPTAITHFNNYLTDVRNGHAVSGSNSAFVGLGWSYARTQDFGGAYQNFNTALGAAGGSTNSDALVGMGGLFLSMGYDGTNYTFENATMYLTSAIGLPGDYSSGVTHDDITETDLLAARALSKFLSGDIAGAQSDAVLARQTADTQANFASIDTLNMIEWMAGHI